MYFFSIKCSPKFYWFYPEIASVILFFKVFVILILLQPFELDRFTLDIQAYFSLIFSVVAGGTYYLSFLVVVNYLDDRWTVGKDLIWAIGIFLSVTVINYWIIISLEGKVEVKMQLETPTFTDVLKYSFTIGGIIYYLIYSTDKYLMNFSSILKLEKNKKI